jgi:uncharacterized small protein (DUF1192 family)
MDLEELEPKNTKTHELGADLSKFPVGDLKALAETLRAEIVRVEQAMAAKRSSLNAAESVFKR